MSTPAEYFSALYATDDPYGYRDRWYELRKRQLLLASLPHDRFAAAWEIGCSNGETTAALAARCDRLLATDLDARAVRLATERTAASGNVVVRQALHPDDWPDGRFDLVVFSEIGYFLDAAALARVVQQLRGTLSTDGTLVACHWLAVFAQAPQSGREVHAQLAQEFGPPTLFRYEDADFLLEGWSASAHSLAQREGLR